MQSADGHSLITPTNCLGLVFSWSVKVPLYHSLVSAPTKSSLSPEIFRMECASGAELSSVPSHVPCSNSESEFLGSAYAKAITAAQANKVISLVFIMLRFVLTTNVVYQIIESCQA